MTAPGALRCATLATYLRKHVPADGVRPETGRAVTVTLAAEDVAHCRRALSRFSERRLTTGRSPEHETLALAATSLQVALQEPIVDARHRHRPPTLTLDAADLCLLALALVRTASGHDGLLAVEGGPRRALARDLLTAIAEEAPPGEALPAGTDRGTGDAEDADASADGGEGQAGDASPSADGPLTELASD